MTKAEAIAMIEDDKKRHHDELSGRYRAALTMAIKALQQEPKWIPVTERLPEEGEIVLVTDTLWNIKSVNIDWWNGEQWVRNGQYVIAWQPLPEPYEEAEQ